MLAALPVAADVLSFVVVSDRTETRLRQPGDVPAGPSVDLATSPEVHLTVASPRLGLALAYTPRLTLWDVNDVGWHPTGLNTGSMQEQTGGATAASRCRRTQGTAR